MIRKLILSGILCALAMLSLQAIAAPYAFPFDIQKQLDLPENKIDIGFAALTFAKEIYPDLDIAAYSKKIDRLAQQVKRLAKGTRDPEKRIQAMNTVIYQSEGFHYDRSPNSMNKQEYYFLNGILDTKQGICYTMPLLYIAVAQRLGYPVYPIVVPGHYFVRYISPPFKGWNIETTSGGKDFTDESYIEHFAVSKRGLESGSYMRTLTYREYLGYILGMNAVVFGRNGEEDRKIIGYLKKAIQLDPKFAGNYDNLSTTYQALGKVANPNMVWKYRASAEKYAVKAKELGFVNPDAIGQGNGIRGQ